jgi:hypothetical protein
MLKTILELLEYANGETENIQIAQGKYQLPLSIKEAIKSKAKENEWKK